MPSWLITGSSRGVGLGIVQNLLKTESNLVIATARRIDGQEFKDLELTYPKSRFQLVRLNVTDPDSVANAVSLLTTSPLLKDGLDHLIHNAGIHPQPFATFEKIDLDTFQEEILFNTVVPIRLTKAFLPLIKKSKEKKVIFVTSALGSFERTWPLVNECNAYSVGKAALNMVSRKWGASLKYDGVSVAAIHPGWVKTEIGDALLEWMGKNAPQVSQLEVEESAVGVVKVAEAVTLEKTAQFWDYDGTTLPW